MLIPSTQSFSDNGDQVTKSEQVTILSHWKIVIYRIMKTIAMLTVNSLNTAMECSSLVELAKTGQLKTQVLHSAEEITSIWL
jgi:hypothetical protein